ncbi:LysR substrate-binding domain-containing protein [Acidocella sp.]|uniref:LysR substrate-binding domain-containing protein n=1 Tax=Acidocella sp. TaxID=50710 RepID=UPI00183A726B|nr:LysR substrate-binding domain-containing protein [Acidocella sp.]NNM57011.1 LysR family transcriptional regulator [Acidocella sp.]
MAVDLDTGLLRNFLVCTRLGSISRAAGALGRTQPALSQQLRRLEDLVGDMLLERNSGGVTLTAAGAALVPYAERILALSGEALAGVPRSKLSGRCSVGVLEDFTGTALPSVFADFARMHPDTTLELLSLVSVDTQEALDAGRIQLALCDAAFLRRPLRWSRLMPLLWAAAEGFDTSIDPVPLVVFSEPCSWRGLMQAALSSAGRRWRVAFESGSLTAVQAAVRAGLGVTALLPTSMAGLVSSPIANVLPHLPDIAIGLSRRPESEGNKLVDAVEEMVKQLVWPDK